VPGCLIDLGEIAMTLLRTTALAAAVALAPVSIPIATAQSNNGSAPLQPPAAAQPQTQVDDLTVHKVGAALRHVAAIRQEYLQQAQASKSVQQQSDLTTQAKQNMVKAISDQGLSVDQYEQVIHQAQNDPMLKQRLMAVAQSGN
jgi:LPS O-antigen subunit length determinant protein (WzzB/FepE family)